MKEIHLWCPTACFQNPAVRRTATWIAAGATCGMRKKEHDPERGLTTTGGTSSTSPHVFQRITGGRLRPMPDAFQKRFLVFENTPWGHRVWALGVRWDRWPCQLTFKKARANHRAVERADASTHPGKVLPATKPEPSHGPRQTTARPLRNAPTQTGPSIFHGQARQSLAMCHACNASAHTFKSASVTAPSDAVVTCDAYLASTPRV